MNIDFNEALEQMAQAFNTTVDKLYPILIKQAYISGIVSILEFLGSLTVLYIVYKLAMKSKVNYNRASTRWHWIDEGLPFLIALIVLAIPTVITFFLMTSNVPTAFLNPEYWAIKEILRSIKY